MHRGNQRRPGRRRVQGQGVKSSGKKVGSERKAASAGGKQDFGVPVGDPQAQAKRDLASKQIKRHDKGVGGSPPRRGSEGTRTSGVGGAESGVGSSSGGDLDTDIIGVAGGGGVSQSGPDQRTTGPDMTGGESGDAAEGSRPANAAADPRASDRR